MHPGTNRVLLNAVRISMLAGLVLFSTAGLFLHADAPARPTADQMAAIASSLHWQTGTVTLRDGLAKLDLGTDFRYLDPADANRVLHDLWGNPPQPHTLGMIFPADSGPLDHGGWAMVITYEEGGYVRDNDASSMNFNELLKQMQTQIQNINPERIRLGYAPMELVGWATPPRYDKATHKLYWAKELHFGSDPRNTLNYDVRILGRRGVLELNAVASMADFPIIDGEMPKLLAMVDFQPGNSYADFDPKIDKVAKYGLATLIAGGVLATAAKFGLLKFLWPLLLGLKKGIVVVVVAIVAGFKKLAAQFRKKPTTVSLPGMPPPGAP
jgi:uncharacterized membrane-anchored protein